MWVHRRPPLYNKHKQSSMYNKVCCSVLQCVAVCCSVFVGRRTRTYETTIVQKTQTVTIVQQNAVCCSLLHSVAVCCSLLQSVAMCVLGAGLEQRRPPLYNIHKQSPLYSCSLLQSVAVCCSLCVRRGTWHMRAPLYNKLKQSPLYNKHKCNKQLLYKGGITRTSLQMLNYRSLLQKSSIKETILCKRNL